jgi:adenylate cyclase
MVLKDLLVSVIEPTIAKHYGRIVKLMGDGLMAEFTSVVEAVVCAAEIQSSMAARPGPDAASTRMIFRIGINLGDVLIDGQDLLGNGLNIAARLEKLCQPGDVLISGSAFEHVTGKMDAVFEYAGEQHLKNIDRVVKAYHLKVSNADEALPRDTGFENPRLRFSRSKTCPMMGSEPISATE